MKALSRFASKSFRSPTIFASRVKLVNASTFASKTTLSACSIALLLVEFSLSSVLRRNVALHLRTHFAAATRVSQKASEYAHMPSIWYENIASTVTFASSGSANIVQSKCRRVANEASAAGALRESSDVEGDADAEASREGGNGVTGSFIASAGAGDDSRNDGSATAAGETSTGAVTCAMRRSARLAASFADAREARLARGPSNVWTEIGAASRTPRAFARQPSRNSSTSPHTTHTVARNSAACVAASEGAAVSPASIDFAANFTAGAIDATTAAVTAALLPSHCST
mmetsp:Transcript_703/g.2940  ORF Transcript_703/g.2940 Transcript_703/m.2940 type:complete len:287 (+) Transcript_703:1338-2198(+)